ncbi:MAG TPA: glycoside hydrolase [Desulfotomaculum sp.]|nr:glycoside hydrolase [Desulfotomaculum sp.]
MQEKWKRSLTTGLFLLILLVMCPFQADAVEFYRNLTVGLRGPDVLHLQEELAKLGHLSTKPTDYFGWEAHKAVTRFEHAMGICADGLVTKKEWDLLFSPLASFSGRSLAKGGDKVIFGYYPVDYPEDKTAFNSLWSFGEDMSAVGFFTVRLDQHGSLTGFLPPDGLAAADRYGIQSILVVHNCRNGRFDQEAVHRILTDRELENRLIREILRLLEKNGLAGVNIDFEKIPPADRGLFNGFLQRLAGALRPAGFLLTVAVAAKTYDDPSNPWSGAFDYQAIGRICDYVMLMTYDEHWAGGPPGPVSSVPWITRVLDFALGRIPKEKILLGIPAYGYDWTSERVRVVRWKQVNRLISRYGWGRVVWDNCACSPSLQYWEGGAEHQVWFENRYSLRIKLNVVKEYDLAGITVWRLGFEDAVFWKTIRDFR